MARKVGWGGGPESLAASTASNAAWDRKPWTPNSLIRAVRRLAAAGLVRQDVLAAAPKRVDSDDLVLMVARLARLEPGLTLDGIARRLQSMGQRSPRGGLRWSRSSVKNLLDRAK